MIDCDDGGNEAVRLYTLKSYQILDTPQEAQFDDIATAAVAVTGAPIALISLIDEDRQWFKAKIGMNRMATDRSTSFCAHTISGPDTFVIEDASEDDRFSKNPLVLGDPGVRFYCGVPLTAPSGHRIGTLCVIDTRPRPPLTESQVLELTGLAARAMDALEARKQELAIPLDRRDAERMRAH